MDTISLCSGGTFSPRITASTMCAGKHLINCLPSATFEWPRKKLRPLRSLKRQRHPGFDSCHLSLSPRHLLVSPQPPLELAEREQTLIATHKHHLSMADRIAAPSYAARTLLTHAVDTASAGSSPPSRRSSSASGGRRSASPPKHSIMIDFICRRPAASHRPGSSMGRVPLPMHYCGFAEIVCVLRQSVS